MLDQTQNTQQGKESQDFRILFPAAFAAIIKEKLLFERFLFMEFC